MHPRREECSGRVLSPIRILLTSPPPPALGRNERKDAKAQRRKDAKVGDLAQRSGRLAIAPMLGGGLRGKARFTHPTENLQTAWPPLPSRALAGGEGAGGGEGRPRVRLLGFSPESGTSLPLVRQPPDPGG